jgi:acyl carrier protein
MSDPISKHDAIRSTILAMLPAGRARSQADGGIDASTRLLEVGLIDSARLLDIILEVESRCGVEFNPERIDLETGVTFGSLIGAFDPVSK